MKMSESQQKNWKSLTCHMKSKFNEIGSTYEELAVQVGIDKASLHKFFKNEHRTLKFQNLQVTLRALDLDEQLAVDIYSRPETPIDLLKIPFADKQLELLIDLMNTTKLTMKEIKVIVDMHIQTKQKLSAI